MSEPKTLSFPRSDGPLVSVLLPTRGRVSWLTHSVQSLYNLSVNKDKVEYLFRVDTDDISTINCCASLVSSLPCASLLVEPRGDGYYGMHNMVNRLCSIARGDWLLIWNDDALMQTQAWDHILLHGAAKCWHQCPDVYMFILSSKGRPACNEFMFLRRSVTQILGHWSLSPHSDNWIMRVMGGVDSLCKIPIELDHCSDRINDKIREETEAAYGNGKLARETLESDWAQKAIQEDVTKLRNWIGLHGK